jgi:hypothetical protein
LGYNSNQNPCQFRLSPKAHVTTSQKAQIKTGRRVPTLALPVEQEKIIALIKPSNPILKLEIQ